VGALDFALGWAWLVPALMTASFVIVGLAGRRLEKLEWGGWIAVAFSFAAMLVGLLVGAAEMLGPGTYTDTSYTWLSIPGSPGVFSHGFSLVIGVLVDPISALMLIVVTVVGFLVMLYSIGYMHHDKGLPRYYAELSLFLTAMTGLVLADNLLEFFLFWELVGVCSYFLIGFYYEKPSAASAAKEAFLVTRIGDVLFLLGIFIYFATYATSGPGAGWAANGFKFANGQSPFLAGVMGGNTTTLTIAGLLMLAGAAGKSAQFPLHVWLPDAMEGPTTVSALIHAATMVAAGVYLLAITSIFLGFTPADQLAIVGIGGFTCFFAATMAVFHTDIKRVIAYSTISQLGYMVLAIGAGYAMVGMFHLFTHAFFKALLFLAAGSVIHAVGTQDLRKMGGLHKAMPLTSIAFLAGALSLSGIPLTAGFFSKDDILGSVFSATSANPAYWPFFLLAMLTVFLTAYYIFRAWFMAFWGPGPRDASLPHAHEGPWVMRLPLILLSLLAVFAGYLIFAPGFASLLSGSGIPPSFDATSLALSGVSAGLAVCGIALAWTLWGSGRMADVPAGSALDRLRTVVLRRYYFKAGYDWLGLRAVYGLSRAADFFERYVVDGTIRGIERLFSRGSEAMRRVQSGIVSDYAAYVVAGLVGFLLILLVIAPAVIQATGGG
jgi:NADH-quinone oxidoreductase subunit L